MTNQMRIKQRANWLHTEETEISVRLILIVLITTRNRGKADRLSSLKFIRLLRVVFTSQQRLNRPAVNAVQ